MQIDFLLFGATGMQGQIVTRDLIENGYRVAISDLHKSSLEKLQQIYNLPEVYPLNLTYTNQVLSLIQKVQPKVIINCAEGNWNLELYKAALRAKVHIVDLGSDTEVTIDQIALHEKFKEQNLIAITGCGSTPGINNVMLSHAAKKFDEITTVKAGFAWNSNIKSFVVPFSMESIIEEFLEPADVIRKGKLVKNNLHKISTKKFRGVGTVKNFLVRHPEPYTFLHYFKNQGLQNVWYYAGFPEHSFTKIEELAKNTDLKKRTVSSKEFGTIPLGKLTKVMQQLHKPPAGYTEVENLWVLVKGMKNGVQKQLFMECIVPTLPDWMEAGCNIDTGFPASIMAQMILKNELPQYGSFGPEAIIPHKAFFHSLIEKGMTIWENGKLLDFDEQPLPISRQQMLSLEDPQAEFAVTP